MTQEQKDTLIRLALSPNRPSIALVCRMAQSVMIDPVPSESTCRRFLARWKDENKALWVLVREGEKACEAIVGRGKTRAVRMYGVGTKEA